MQYPPAHSGTYGPAALYTEHHEQTTPAMRSQEEEKRNASIRRFALLANNQHSISPASKASTIGRKLATTPAHTDPVATQTKDTATHLSQSKGVSDAEGPSSIYWPAGR